MSNTSIVTFKMKSVSTYDCRSVAVKKRDYDCFGLQDSWVGQHPSRLGTLLSCNLWVNQFLTRVFLNSLKIPASLAFLIRKPRFERHFSNAHCEYIDLSSFFLLELPDANLGFDDQADKWDRGFMLAGFFGQEETVIFKNAWCTQVAWGNHRLGQFELLTTLTLLVRLKHVQVALKQDSVACITFHV